MDIWFTIISYTKTTRAQSDWRRMASDPAVRGKGTQRSGIILSLIGSWSRRHPWNVFPILIWLGITLQRHYRNLNSVDSVTSFLVSMRMTFHPTTHLEELYLRNENQNWRKRNKKPRRLPNSQATGAANECVGRSLIKESLLTDYQCTPSAGTMECAGRSVLYHTCIFRT